jgi:hypothetical protein
MNLTEVHRLPDLTFGPLRLWALGRQFPDSSDQWDGNWLTVMAHCDLAGAQVTTCGPWIHISELEAWQCELRELDRTISGTASLNCIEPYLQITVEAKKLGQLLVTVDITPDDRTQTHRFHFELNQTFLRPLISDISQILIKYPEKR